MGAEVSESEMSTSPKAFLKAMTKGVKGNQPKQREERGGSLIDNFLRRGRSSSKDQGGSRSSSRQGSVEKGKDAESSSSYVSAGSGENFDDMSESGSDVSFFRKKKKPRKVTTVDFDELFAKGHAMSKEMEQNQEPNGHTIHHYQQVPLSPTTTETTFEVFSKDEAFRKSQKSSGISYAEKVQSYLTDQKTTGHPFDGSDQVQNQSVV